MEHAHVVRAAVVDQRNGAACAQDAVDAYFCTVGRFDLQVVKRPAEPIGNGESLPFGLERRGERAVRRRL